VRSKDKRNNHWKGIVNKAGYEGRLIAESNDEELVFLAEQERIDQLRRLGINLANKTDGGCGGTKGYHHTDEAKRKISEKVKVPVRYEFFVDKRTNSVLIPKKSLKLCPSQINANSLSKCWP
jgi:hypothetical protein